MESINCVWMTVSPVQARKWLDAARDAGIKNRPINRAWVKTLAYRMVSQWDRRPDNIVRVTPTGAVVGGQHRLVAQIEANIPVGYWIDANASEQWIAMDNGGKKTTVGNGLALMGETNANVKAAIVRSFFLLSQCGTGIPGNLLTVDGKESLPILDEHRESVELAIDMLNHGKHRPPAHVIGVASLTLPMDPDRMVSFWRKLTSGLEMREGDPENALRDALARPRGYGGFSSSTTGIRLSCLAACTAMDGMKASLLREGTHDKETGKLTINSQVTRAVNRIVSFHRNRLGHPFPR